MLPDLSTLDFAMFSVSVCVIMGYHAWFFAATNRTDSPAARTEEEDADADADAELSARLDAIRQGQQRSAAGDALLDGSDDGGGEVDA
ncbi:MAG: hypothetical protein ACI8S6_004466 [Myxococcota bacterium]